MANGLAHEVLGRCLDELPPQTRRLLDLIDGMVTRRASSRASTAATTGSADVRCVNTPDGAIRSLQVHLSVWKSWNTCSSIEAAEAASFVYELAYQKPTRTAATLPDRLDRR